MAPDDIRGGQAWDDAIPELIEVASAFVVVLTPASAASPNVKDEISWALDLGKHVVPVMLQPCKRPLRILRHQYVPAHNQPHDRVVERLAATLQDQPTAASLRAERVRWPRWAAILGAGVSSGLAGAWLAPDERGSASDVRCTFDGRARSLRVEGNGEAALVRGDLFTDASAAPIELRHFTLSWHDETGALRRASPDVVRVGRSDSLLPVNRQATGRYVSAYHAGKNLEVDLIEGGAAGYVEGELSIAGGEPLPRAASYELLGHGRRSVVVTPRALSPPIYLAGPFRGLEKVQLVAAYGHCSCWRADVEGRDLTWQGGLSDLVRVELGPQGLGLRVNGGTPAFRQPASPLWRLLVALATFSIATAAAAVASWLLRRGMR